jgi:hypothetical protein
LPNQRRVHCKSKNIRDVCPYLSKEVVIEAPSKWASGQIFNSSLNNFLNPFEKDGLKKKKLLIQKVTYELKK